MAGSTDFHANKPRMEESFLWRERIGRISIEFGLDDVEGLSMEHSVSSYPANPPRENGNAGLWGDSALALKIPL